jgi:hypothetical protein
MLKIGKCTWSGCHVVALSEPCPEIFKTKKSDPYIDPYIGEVPKPNSHFIRTQFLKNDLLSDIFVEIRNENKKVLNWINRLLTSSMVKLVK